MHHYKMYITLNNDLFKVGIEPTTFALVVRITNYEAKMLFN